MTRSEKENSKKAAWRTAVAAFQHADHKKSLWQVANSVIPYLLLWALMVVSLDLSYWLTLALALPAAGFLVRIFIILHDCGHGSFFNSRTANDRLGFVTGVLTFTPYFHWRHAHAQHHASSGDLDRRGSGDIWTLTVQEYLESSRWRQLAYRAYRNPFVMFLIGPSFVFLVGHRFAGRDAARRERSSVYLTNLVLGAIIALMALTIGIRAYLLVQLPIVLLAMGAGVWLFYVQHQFEGVYWERHDKWDYVTAALKGSSYYHLPRLLQWFTGNIGFHHIHHLSPRIPNYFLEACYQADPVFKPDHPLSLSSSLRSLNLRLWDEENRQMVGFGYLKQLRLQTESV